MLKMIYWVISAFILVMILWNYFEEDELQEHLNAILVIIPFVLRLLFIK